MTQNRMYRMKESVSIEEVINDNGFFVNTIEGMSMHPMLRPNRDTVLIRPYTGRLKKYDVALYKVGDNYILHRIIKVLPDSYIIRGDHRMDKEYGITDDDIIGVLEEFYRDNKQIKVTNVWYKVYTIVWNYIFPIRFLNSRIRGGLGRLKRSFFRKESK